MSTTLTCNDPKGKSCTWSGGYDELVSLTDVPEDRAFDFCPVCNGDDFVEEEDDDDDADDDFGDDFDDEDDDDTGGEA